MYNLLLLLLLLWSHSILAGFQRVWVTDQALLVIFIITIISITTTTTIQRVLGLFLNQI